MIVQCCVSSHLVPQCVYGQISTLLFYSRHRQRHAQRMTHSSLDSSYRETRVLGVARDVSRGNAPHCPGTGSSAHRALDQL